MTTLQALLAFGLAATLLTLTPGLDTALILRTAIAEGPRRAALAAAGILLGCLAWGAAAAFGVGALLAASTIAFNLLKWAGALYLFYLGIKLILAPRERFSLDAAAAPATGGGAWLARGLLTNLLNPKVGIFYVSFLPQFVPQGVAAAPFMFGLALIHIGLGALWAAVLIAGTRPLKSFLQKSQAVRWLDRITGGVFLAFGLRLALEKHS